MNRRTTLGALVGVLACSSAQAQLPRLKDPIEKGSPLPGQSSSTSAARAADERSTIAGLKEALAVGTERAVSSLSRPDGYFGNQAVKILMPASIRKVADAARLAGFQKQVDSFVLSMNRAAEAAVPMASRFFGDAIRDMTFGDARGILTGGDTAATDYFRRKTQDRLFASFRPVVSKKVDEVGATRAYKEMMGGYGSMPLAGRQSLDLDDYVTGKALDGLFHMVGEEERRIRSNPAARTTELLKKVFGS